MSTLTNPATGHTVSTDEASVDFWKVAGYRVNEEPKPAAKKTAAAKRSSGK